MNAALRKIFPLAMAEFAVLATGCAADSGMHATHIDGEIFWWSEFNLYPNARGTPGESQCVSGTLPVQDHLKAQRKFDGRFVRVYGRLVPYASLQEGNGIEKEWAGAPILNYCHGDKVLLATRIEFLKPPPRTRAPTPAAR